jgi:CRP-like cAMP-binding protein
VVDPALIAASPLFTGLSSAAIAALADRAVERRYSAGEVIYPADTVPVGLFVILEGRVRVVRGRGDRQHLIHHEAAGGALGEVPVFGGGTYPATAIAAEPTRCLLLLSEALLAATQAHPAIALTFLRRLGERTRHLVDRVDRLAAQSVTGRLARLLLEQQQAAGAGVAFGLGKTGVEVAEELGTVREVVVRALRQLRENGIIESAGRGRYRVRDADTLAAMAR